MQNFSLADLRFTEHFVIRILAFLPQYLQDIGSMGAIDQHPKIILFGDSLTDWGFYEENHGFGWAVGQYYGGKVEVLNEGTCMQDRDLKLSG